MEGYWGIIDRMKEFRQKQQSISSHVEDDDVTSVVSEQECVDTTGESSE